MRAIIRCTATFEKQDLESLLADINWWPTVDQSDPLVRDRAQDIITHIADSDRGLAERTLLCTIYDDATKTWGIVSNPSLHVLTFRLKNPVSEKLKVACERLVIQLQPHVPDHRSGRTPVEFSPSVEIFEPNSQDHAFSGAILPPARFWLAVKERKTEAYVGLFTTLLAIVFLTSTSPLVRPWLMRGFDSDWQQWFSGNLERFSTAALVTLTISWFEVFLHWFSLRRQSSIRWTLE